MPADLEHGEIEVTYIRGYPSLAKFIASDPDKSTVIYRRFDRLSARSLLYLQSELAELEARQDLLDAEDLNSAIEVKESASDWSTFKDRSEAPDNEHDRIRMKVVLEIRDKIKEYSESSTLDLYIAATN